MMLLRLALLWICGEGLAFAADLPTNAPARPAVPPAVRPPPSRFQVSDPVEWRKIIAPGVDARVLANNLNRFTAGPAWDSRNRRLIFSEIPTNALFSWDATRGIQLFRQPSSYACPNVFDLEGRLLTGENANGRIVRLEPSGEVNPLVSQHLGKRFNSPYDIAVRSDGTLWFTDPGYGIAKGAASEQGGLFAYRYDPKTDTTTRVGGPYRHPTGICFSPDEKLLYLMDAGSREGVQTIFSFMVQADGTLTDIKGVVDILPGTSGGIRCDIEGRIWVCAANGIHVHKADGSKVGQIGTALSPSGLCWGGPEGRTLFITARRYLYAIETLTLPASAARETRRRN